MEMIPKVLQAVAGQGHLVYIYFHDGTVRLYDASPLLEKGGVFAPLRDDAIFRERLTVLNDTVAWDLDGNRDPSRLHRPGPLRVVRVLPRGGGPPSKRRFDRRLALIISPAAPNQHHPLWDLRGKPGNTGPPSLPGASSHIHSKTACRGFKSFCPCQKTGENTGFSPVFFLHVLYS